MDCPPVFALVPRSQPPSEGVPAADGSNNDIQNDPEDGSDPTPPLKLCSGWMICRKVQPGGFEVNVNDIGREKGNLTSLIKEEDSSDDENSDNEKNESGSETDKKGLNNDEKSVGQVDMMSIATADLPEDWVELYDPEDRQILRSGDRVLCLRNTGTTLTE